MESALSSQAIFRKHIALPQDHGSWVFLFTPLVIGLIAGGSFTAASAWLCLAALAAFLIRQPVTIAVKAYSGRRARRELPAAWLWITVYGLAGLVAAAALALLGFGYLMVLVLPALPVFAFHLVLVSRREERRQMGVEMVGAGVLALIAPAALWVGKGQMDPAGWWLFLLSWFQAAASIVYAYLRLEQRPLPAVPAVPERWRMGRRALLYSGFNFIAVSLLAVFGVLPALLPLAFGLQFAEVIYGTLRPAVGLRPVIIGTRQLVVSLLFTAVFIAAWLLGG